MRYNVIVQHRRQVIPILFLLQKIESYILKMCIGHNINLWAPPLHPPIRGETFHLLQTTQR